MLRHGLLAAGLVLGASHASAEPYVLPYPALVQGPDYTGDGWGDPVFVSEILTTIEEGNSFAAPKLVYDSIFPVWRSGIGRVALAIVPDRTGNGRPDIATTSRWQIDFSDPTTSKNARLVLDDLDPAKPEAVASFQSLRNSVDGDKIPDLVVGIADYASSCAGLAETDAVYATSSKTGGRAWKSVGPRGGGMFGALLATLSHDYDGDGLRDVATTDVCQSRKTAEGVSAGAVYVLSARTGAILKTFRNPTLRSATTAGSWWFGTDLIELPDLTGDGVPELAVGEPAAPGAAVAGGVTVISGASGAQVCRYAAPRSFGARFGSDLDGGDFTFGKVAGVVTKTGYKPHDILVGSPRMGIFVLRLDPKTCGTSQMLVKAIASTPDRILGDAVVVLRPPKGAASITAVTLATARDGLYGPSGLYRFSGLNGAYLGNFGNTN